MDKWYCYILRSLNNNYTYNGSTNNLSHRIKQHNGYLVGGAKSTISKRPWEYYVIIEGFKSKSEALSCEWRIRRPLGKRNNQFKGITGRVKSLNYILSLDKWTSRCQNCDNIYTVYLADDVIALIDKNKIKSNIIINSLSNFKI